MARIFFEFVLPILLPTILYGLWLVGIRRRAEAPGNGKQPLWVEAPWVWLLALGLAFAGLLTLAIALFGGGPANGIYVAPHIQDGQVVPGHVEPK
jgi:hypothetical protein